ncbi:HAMP domain-containing sensor histidine kinase [Flavivirga amylovorans]|uniref:histidine kinase n=1 Tax=Flavivirga amylovorans TaxID=870486 RepID=A0ABT8WXN2_9FLAO|nr:HAMP domain-containing sensor histidine kinase [Flavivirga amylovorans]MDO5986434.1 HAMP domain-containing sensor histidine kinase [Flavivirga amylovorans]
MTQLLSTHQHIVLIFLGLTAIILAIVFLLCVNEFRKNKTTLSKRLRQQNLQISSQEKALNFVKEIFIPIISHDYRLPLVNIKNTLSRVQLDENYKEQDFKKALKELDLQITNTLSFIDNILLCAKNKLIHGDDDLHLISIECFINRNIDLMKQPISEKHLKVFVSLSDALCKKQVLPVSIVDTAIRNLLSNAIKAAPKFSVIDINGSKQANNLIISVTDKGKGLTEYEIKNLFEIPLRTKASLNNKLQLISSWGIGLQLVKNLLESCQGKIWVKPHKGMAQGTTFGFTVPIHE